MNALLLRTLELKKSPSLQTFAQYREAESQNCRHSSVTSDGELLEHQTLELRVHPPNVTVDNDSYDDRTIITVDSANRPGTLVEVVQCLTELGLNVKRARISSDGGWFVDEFHVTEAAGGPAQQGRKVTSEKKLKVIKAVLNVEYEPEGDGSSADGSQHGPLPSHQHHQHHHHRQHSETFDEVWQHSTVFELAGQDRSGLLADVLQLLTLNGCNVRSAAVWTYSGRAAFVVSVVEVGSGAPIRDASKLVRLKQLLHRMMDGDGNGIVTAQPVKGLIHYERRLHQLLLKEEEKEWLRTKDSILARLRLKTANCSCACHAGAANALQPHHQRQPSADAAAGGAGSLTSSPQQQQQLGSIGDGACCGCQIEQAERHIVASEPPPQQLLLQQQQQLQAAGSSPPGGLAAGAAASGAVGAALDAEFCHQQSSHQSSTSDKLLISPKFSRPHVTIQHYCHLNYWLVTIRCKDRNKLFFDTVCTLSDLNYDIYHGAIDQEGDLAVQLYYIRPRFGDFFWDAVKATKLRVMLEAAIQRRFPKGLKVHVRHLPSSVGAGHLGQNWLADLAASWREAGLWITRAKVRAYTDHGHTLYVMDEQGQPPDPRKVQAACQAGGGRLQGPAEGLPMGVSPPHMGGVIGSNSSAPGRGQDGGGAAAAAAAAAGSGVPGGDAAAVGGTGAKFFYMLQQRGRWDGSPSSLTSM